MALRLLVEYVFGNDLCPGLRSDPGRGRARGELRLRTTIHILRTRAGHCVLRARASNRVLCSRAGDYILRAAPITTYRPFLPIVPRPTSTYYASTSYNPYSAAPVTVYRPILGIATPPVIPYTSYRMVYPAQVTYYSPAVSYYSAPAACPVYDVPVQSAAPDSCCAPSSSTMETPTLPSDQSSTSYYIPSQPDSSTIITAKPNTDDSATVTRQVEKPITSSDPKAAPTDEKASGLNLNEQKQQNQPKAKENSLPLPNSRDSQDRTTMRPVRQVSHEKAVPAQPSGQVLSADLWHQAND